MKGFACLLVFFVIAPGSTWPHNGTLAYVLPLSGITIDGNSSDWPDSLVRYPITHITNRRQKIEPRDLTASFRAGFDPAAGLLYILVEVGDDTLVIERAGGRRRRFGVDGCSLFLDVRHDDISPASQFSVYGTERVANHQAGSREGWTGVGVGVLRTETTHTYEWVIDLHALGVSTLSQMHALGFDIEVYDADTRGRGRTTRITWGQGGRKLSAARHRADLLLLPDDVSTHRISGKSRWTAS